MGIGLRSRKRQAEAGTGGRSGTRLWFGGSCRGKQPPPASARRDSEPGPFPRQRRLSCGRREAAGWEWQKRLQAEVEKNLQVQKGDF
ncbi:uncharacterized protein LOC103281120 isoform X2 [Anolis carolinensis]|uniref:uncharacterized protein LOC134292303 isoform X2 n=1 Tax=Anolis carolinensis TaxID=28377 RepID=UPI002F2B875F